MIYYFFITTSSSIIYQVYPLNWLECSLVDEKEEGQIFYRRKFEGDLTFGGKKLCADFDLFYDLWQFDPCGRIEFLIIRDTDIYWEGYFSPSEGQWDLDNKTFTVKPLTTDDYSGWDDEGDFEYNALSVATTVTVECNGISYTRNRWLIDVIEYLADKIFPGCTVTTNFFTYLTDYVTHLPSKLLYLTLIAKSDFKRPGASDPATVANLAFNDMMYILKMMFNCYWTYDLTGNIVRIEHVSYWEASQGLDLRPQEIAVASNKFRYKKEGMPKYEKFHFMESWSADFIGDTIWYDDICVNQDSKSNVIEYSINITTEVEPIQTEPDIASDEGFVMLANYKEGANYYTYVGAGIRDTVVRTNMPLAWSYLHINYHRHNRVLLDGYMNFTETTFVSAMKPKIQEINAIICDLDTYDPQDYITTELGETYFGNEKAYVEKAVLRPYGEINFTLAYGPVDNEDEGPPDETPVLDVIREDLDVYSYLSEPNIYDTYYSIWTNDDTCDVITILAGVQYQHDVLTQINPIVTVKYNFTDPSLAGWSIRVDGGTTYDTCTDVDCDTGAPAPPAVPDIPDFIGHSQATTCGPVHICWTTEVGATYYVLQRKPSIAGGDWWETQYIGSSYCYDDYDAGTKEGTTFYYRVKACNISGCSDYSAEYTVDDIMC